MQWVLFGSSGHKDMPAEGQMKSFNKCTGVLSKQMKCLGNSYWFHYHSTFRPTHVHQCNFRCGPACFPCATCYVMHCSSTEPVLVGTDGIAGSIGRESAVSQVCEHISLSECGGSHVSSLPLEAFWDSFTGDCPSSPAE